MSVDPSASALTWADPHDPANPFNWSLRRKWTTTLLTLTLTFMAAFNSASAAGTATNVNEAFNVSDESFPNSYWPITAWNVGASFFALVGLPLMERFGARPGYLISHALFTLFVLPSALAPNFATIIVTRFISGCFGGILYNGGAGIIADIWATDAERSLPITLFCYLLISGASLGPVFGGLVVAHLDWRWVYWIQFIWFAAFFPILWLVLSETRGNVILAEFLKNEATRERVKITPHDNGKSNKTSIDCDDCECECDEEKGAVEPEHAAAGPHKKSGLWAVFVETVGRPMHLLVTEAVVFSFTLWSAFAVSLVYVSTQSIAQVYGALYGFSPSQAAYVELALFVGATLALLAALPQNAYYLRSASRNTENPNTPIPEARLPLGILASAVGMAGGLFWYAWTSYSRFPWILPSIGLGFVGFAAMAVFQTVGMYITDAYPKYANSAIAAVAFGENMFVAFLPLAAQSMYSTLGFQWASSLLGFVAVGLSCAPVLMFFYGSALRKRSPFMGASTFD